MVESSEVKPKEVKPYTTLSARIEAMKDITYIKKPDVLLVMLEAQAETLFIPKCITHKEDWLKTVKENG